MSNLDSIIGCDALVFMRYILLNYLAFRDESTFYDKFDAIRKVHTINTFGMKLLTFFLDKFRYLIQEVSKLIKSGFDEKAVELLHSFVNLHNEPIQLGTV